MLIMRMHFQMLNQLVYPLGEQRYLNFTRASITIINFEIGYNGSLFFFVQIYTPSNMSL